MNRLQQSKMPMNRLATVYVAILFAAQSLVMHDGYFDITETKLAVFYGITLVFLLIASVILLGYSGRKIGLRREDKMFLLLCLLYCVVSAWSGAGVWLGADNRYQGICTWLLYFLVFLILSRAVIAVWAYYCMALVFALVMILSVLNHWGWDPLGVLSDLVAFDRGRFISTMGNINFFGSYVCLVLPMLWGLWLFFRKEKYSLFLLLCIILGTVVAAASKSECTVLGLVVTFAAVPLMGRKRPEILPQWGVLLFIMAMTLYMFGLLTKAVGGDGFSRLMQILMRPIVCAVMAAVGLGIYGLCRGRNNKQRIYFHKCYCVTYGIVFILLILFIVFANCISTDMDLGVAGQYLVIDSDWGTDRGRVWRACVKMWTNMPLWHKMLGGGSGCVAAMDRMDPVFKDAVLDAAHNEFLHYLLTHGVVGLCLYLGLNLSVLIRAVKKASPISLALAFGVVGYLAQSAVNIAQPMTTPLYFLLLSILAGVGRQTSVLQQEIV